MPNFKQSGTHTYFFESGVYYFNTGNWGPIDDGTNNNLWLIGGTPDTATDQPLVWKSGVTPCYSQITANSAVYNTSNGYGVEWIAGGTTWLDVHTVHLELFSRIGGGASEGAQNISFRDVPQLCSKAGVQQQMCLPTAGGWAPSSPGTPGQVLQIDQNTHIPNIFIHGGIFCPFTNVELYSNNSSGVGSSQIYTGPIDANSLELASEQATGTVVIGAGGAQPTVFELTVVATDPGGAGNMTEQATVDEKQNYKVLNWRVCAATPGQSPAPARGTFAFCTAKQG